MDQNTRTAARGGGWRGWLVVATMCLAQVISTIDRGMLALVIDPVRTDLAISEMQIALLQGFAFSIFYVTVGLPLGAVADVVNRRKLLLAGIAVWSAATIAGGFAQGFGSMFASRIFIGVGEAVLGPCAVTMISDLFPPARRGRPMALYVFGSMIAFGLGSLICGVILDAAPRGAFAGLPVIGALAPWRIAFVLIGSSGVILLALLATMREPERVSDSGTSETRLPFRQGLAQMRGEARVLLPYYGALAFFAVGAVVATGWGAVFLTRTFAYDLGSAGKLLGASQMIWAALGAVTAGIWADRAGARFGVAGRMRLAAVLALLAIPSALPLLAANGTVAIVLLGEVMFIMAIYGTTMLSALSELAPQRLRGFAVALYAFVMTLIGGSLGPVAVAWLTESVFADPLAVGWSMGIVGSAALSLSALFAGLAATRISATKQGAQ